jgi:hypothetical protein
MVQNPLLFVGDDVSEIIGFQDLGGSPEHVPDFL